MSKNQTKKTIGERIISIVAWLSILSLAYFCIVADKKNAEENKLYPKSFVDSVLAKNAKIEFLEKDSAFIEWSNAGTRYAFRKWLKLNPNKKTWGKIYIDQKPR